MTRAPIPNPLGEAVERLTARCGNNLIYNAVNVSADDLRLLLAAHAAGRDEIAELEAGGDALSDECDAHAQEIASLRSKLDLAVKALEIVRDLPPVQHYAAPDIAASTLTEMRKT